MKRQTTLMIIILTAVVAAIFSFMISNALFGSPKRHPILVPVVQKISPTFPLPQTDPTYQTFFNQQALDPTQLIQIGGNGNTSPFNGQSQ
jgi:hypothetical protein